MFRTIRGPKSVYSNLCKGLHEINLDYEVNPHRIVSGSVIHVLSGTRALNDAIRLKKDGKIKKIIAGPNLVVTPLDKKKILCNPLIDNILVPSEWVRDFYVSIAPEIAPKIKIWASGVEQKQESTKNALPIVYIKNNNSALTTEVLRTLDALEQKYILLTYGTFKKDIFDSLIQSAPWMVYVGKSESQGLALHEAWMADVPTFVYNLKKWSSIIEGKEYTWFDEKIAAPYLTKETGAFWFNTTEFSIKFKKFISNLHLFSARKYSTENFTNKISAQKLKGIIDTSLQIK